MSEAERIAEECADYDIGVLLDFTQQDAGRIRCLMPLLDVRLCDDDLYLTPLGFEVKAILQETDRDT